MEDDPIDPGDDEVIETIQPLAYATPATRNRSIAPIAGLACIVAAYIFGVIAVVPGESRLIVVLLPLSLLLATAGTGMAIGSLTSRINHVWIQILAAVLSVAYWSVIVLSSYHSHL